MLKENRNSQRLFAAAGRYYLPAYCLLAAFTVLAICSKSSFLYPLNDWVDANCYFTVGKGMMRGRVVYRDLFEQKGVLLYFLHGLAWLASHTSFIGVFVLEVLAGAAFLYLAAKTVKLFAAEMWAYIAVPVLAALTYSSAFFAHGDSAEEFCLPLLAAGLYSLMKFFKQGNRVSPRAVVAGGALAGCVLWIKYTMLGFWAAWGIAVFVGLLLNKRVREALLAPFRFLAGMAAATLPWFVYFAANGALTDWFHAYFTLNATAYGKFAGLWEMIANSFDIVYRNVMGMPALAVLAAAGIAGFVCTNKLLPGVWPKVSFALLYALLGFGVYCGGRKYPYYFLILAGTMLLPGLIAAAKGLSGLGGLIRKRCFRFKPDAKLSAFVFAACCAAALALSSAYAWQHYQYRSFMDTDKSTLAQYRFAEIMNAEENPTLLNYGFLDGGFYTAADILPGTKYFCKLNVTLPEMTRAQEETIQNGAVQFVVVRSGGAGDGRAGGALSRHYEQVASVRQKFEGKSFTYYLYKLKSQD